MIKRPLLFVACIFLCGILYGLERRISMLIFGGTILLCGVVPFLYYKQRMRALLYLLISFIIFPLSVFFASKEEKAFSLFEHYADEGEQVSYYGKVVSMKETTAGYRYLLSDVTITKANKTSNLKHCVLYSEEKAFEFVWIYGTAKPTAIDAPRNYGEFDSKKYYRSLGIPFLLKAENINLISGKSVLGKIKTEMKKVFSQSFSQKEAGVITAIVFGERGDLDQEIKGEFQKAGISHILSVSGLHISLIGMGIYKLLRKRKISFFSCGLCAGLLLYEYLLLTGNGISTKRAVIMFVIAAIAKCNGRRVDLLSSLSVALLIILLNNPFYVYSSGFVLSFMAITGVGLWRIPRDDVKKTGFSLIKERFLESFSVSWGIFITSLPIMLYAYYSFSPYTVLTNLIVLPLMTPLLLLAILIGILGAMFGVGGFVHALSYLCELLLHTIESITTFVNQFPGSCVITGRPAFCIIILFYLFILLLLVLKRRRIQMFVATLCVGLFFIPVNKPQITFLDVGQGDAVFIETNRHSTIFVDGGSSSLSKVGEYRIIPFLQASGISEIDYWFVSHFDEDHTSGLTEALEHNYRIKRLLIPEAALADENSMDIIERARNQGTAIISLVKGNAIVVDDYQLRCVWPVKNTAFDDRNDSSLGLVLDNGEISLLLCGDITSKIEADLLKQNSIGSVDIYKCSHHGSNYSSSEEFLAQIKPKISIVSCALHNRYGHPGKDTVKRLKSCGTRILYTMYSGQISIKKAGTSYYIEEFLNK